MLGFRQEWDAARAAGDSEAITRLERQMNQEVIADEIYRRTMGSGDASSPIDALAPPEILLTHMVRRETETWNATAEAADAAGLDVVVQQWNDIQRQYKEANAEELAQWKSASPEEQAKLQRQMTPLQIDPNQVAEMRQTVTQIDTAMREASGGKLRFWNHPRLRGMAEWMNRETGAGQAGFFQSGEQPIEMGVLGNIGMGVLTGAEGVTDFGLNLIYGLQQLAADATGIEAIAPPTNYIVDPETGKWLTNQARPNPGVRELATMLYGAVAGQSIDQALTDVAEATDMDLRTRTGIENLTHGVIGVAALVAPLGKGPQAASGFGVAVRAMGKGSELGAKLLPRAISVLSTTKRGQKIAQIAGKVGGAMLGNGAVMAAAYGRNDDYMSQFFHGAVMAPVMLTLGHMGKGTERWLRTRANMPQRIAAAVGGATEGLGFGALELHDMGLWEFLKNPSEGGFVTIAKNVIAMALLKAAGGRSVGEQAMEATELDYQRSAARRVAAERVVEGKMEDPGVPGLRELGEMQVAMRSEGPGAKRRGLERRRARLEQEMDVEELSPQRRAERELEALLPDEKQGVGSFQAPAQWAKEATKPGVYYEAETLAAMSGRPGKDPVVIPIRKGKVSEGAEGLYMTMENVVRSREGRNLVVAAHEWSHAMQRHSFGSKNPRQFRSDMKEWAEREWTPEMWREAEGLMERYPGAKEWLAEGEVGAYAAEVWAEINARQLMHDFARLQTDAPALTELSGRWLAGKEQAAIRGQFRRIQKSFSKAINVGTEGRIEGLIFGSRKMERKIWAETKGPLVKRVWTKVKEHVFDDLAQMRASRDKWLKAGGIKATDLDMTADPARMMDATRGTAAAIASRLLEKEVFSPFGAPRQHSKPLKKILAEAKDQGISDKELLTYATLIRSLQLGKRGKTTGIPREEATFWLRSRGAKAAKLKEFGLELKRFTDAIVDYFQESGGVSLQDAQKIKDAYAMYVPLQRIIQGPKAGPGGRGVAEGASPVKQIKGGTEQILDPLVGLRDMVHTMVQKSLQARTMGSLAKFAFATAEMGGAGGFASIVPKSKLPKDVKVGEVLKKAFEKATTAEEQDLIEALMEADVSAETVQLFGTKAFPSGERSILQVPVNMEPWELNMLERQYGTRARQRAEAASAAKSVWLEVDTPVYESLMATGAAPPVSKIWSAPANVLRAFATGMNPIFAARNTVRDIMMKPVLSSRGFGARLGFVGGAMDWVAGVMDMAKRGEASQIYHRMGADIGGFFKEGRDEAFRPSLTEARSIRDKSAKAWSRFKKIMSGPGNISESALRIKELKDALKEARDKGMDEQQAVTHALEAARNVTVNFAKGGTTVRMLNQMIPYLKAGAVGQARLFEALKTPRGVANAIANVTVPALVLQQLFQDEEWFQDLPSWRRMNYWNFKLPGMDDPVSIPKPFELGTLFGTIPEILNANEDEHVPEITDAMKQVMLPYMNDGLASLIPVTGRPFVEAMTGYDFFRDRQITPDYMRRSLPAGEQFYESTPPIFPALFNSMPSVFKAMAIDNPLELQRVLDGYTATQATRLSRLGQDIAGAEPGLGISRVALPFLQEHASGALEDEFYEILGEQRANKKSMGPGEQAQLRMLERTAQKMSDVRDDESLGQAERDRKLYELARDALR